MTLQEATELAIEINDRHRKYLRVITIGHFVPHDEELPESLPWKLTVIVPFYAKPRIIASRDELQQYLPKPEPTPAARPVHRESTPMLF